MFRSHSVYSDVVFVQALVTEVYLGTESDVVLPYAVPFYPGD